MIDAPAADVITLSLAASVDELASAHAISHGAVEVGPIRDPGPRLLSKALTIGAVSLATHQLRKSGHPGWAKALRIVVCATWIGLGVHAYRVEKGLR